MAPSSVEHHTRASRSAGGPGFGKIDDVASLRPKGEPTRPQVQFRQLAANATKAQKFSPRDLRMAAQQFSNRSGNASLPVINFTANDFGKVTSGTTVAQAAGRLIQSAGSTHDSHRTSLSDIQFSPSLSRGSSAGSSTSNSSRTTNSMSSNSGRPLSSESALGFGGLGDVDLDLESENSRLRREIATLKDSINSQNRRMSKILGSQFRLPQAQECEDTSPIKVNSVTSKCSLCTALHSKVKRLQKELQEERDTANEAIDRREQLETVLATHAAAAEEERREREDAEKNAEQAADVLHDREKELEKLRNENKLLLSNMNELKTNCTKFNLQIENINGDKRKLQAEIDELKRQLELLQRQNQQQMQSVSKASSDNSQLREAVAQLDKSKKEMGMVERKNEKLQQQVDALQAGSNDLHKQLAEAKARIVEKDKEISELRRRLDAALQAKDAALEAKDAVGNQEQTTKQVLSKMRSEQESLTSEIAKLKAELLEAHKKTKTTEEQRDAQEKLYLKTMRELEELKRMKKKSDELSAELDAARRQEQELKTKMMKGLEEKRQTEKMLEQEKAKHKELSNLVKKAEEDAAAAKQREMETKASVMKDLLGTVRIAVMTPCIKLSVNGRLIFASSQGILPDSKVRDVLEKEVLAKFVQVFPLQEGMEINGGNMGQIIPEFDTCMESLKNEVYSRINQMVDTPGAKK